MPRSRTSCWPTTETDAPAVSGSQPTREEPEPCPRCGGAQIAGALTLPVVGQARFAYNLQGKLIETDVGAMMCQACGSVTLRAADPERIRKAHTAFRRAHPSRT